MKLYALYTLANVLDVALTAYGLHLGNCHERNPVVAYAMQRAGLLSGLLVMALLAQVVIYCAGRRRKWLYVVVAGIHLRMAANWLLLIVAVCPLPLA